MKYRFCRISLLITFLIVLSGCPVPGVSLGNWLFSFSSGGLAGVELLDAGQAQTPNPLPPEADIGFPGTLSWQQNGRTFTLTLVDGTTRVEYTGTVDSRTSIINGGVMESVNGSPFTVVGGMWFAEKL